MNGTSAACDGGNWGEVNMQAEGIHREKPRASSMIDAAWLFIAARILLALSLSVALLVLLAWPAGWTGVRSIIEGLPTMKCNTAVGLALLAAAGLLRAMTIELRGKLHLLPKFIAMSAVALAAASIFEDLTSVDLGIDTLICDDPASLKNGQRPGLMSQGTALGILLIGLGLVFWRSYLRWLGVACTAAGGTVGLVGVLLFLSRATGLRDLPLYSTTAIHTAMLLTAIALGVLLTLRGLQLTQRSDDLVVLRKEIRRARLLAGVVSVMLAVGLLVTMFLVRDSQRHIRDANYAQFLRRSELLTDEIQRRANLCVYGLKGARGMYTGSQHVDRSEFAAYVASRDLPKEFPGAIGFGMIKRVPRAEIDAFVAAERADDAPEFAVTSLGEDPTAYVIQHIYPLDANRRAWGFDVGSEATRRTAIEQAIRSGEPTITGMIHLLQDQVERAGFLYYVPIYRNGTNPQTPAEREADLAGVLYAPIILERALDNMGELIDAGLDFEIFDGAVQTQRTHLYDHDRHLSDFGQEDLDHQAYEGRMFVCSQPITVGGRNWTITTSTLPPFEAEVDRVTPAFFGVGGTALSLLLAGIVWSMGLSQSRATALADDMTRELRESERLAKQAAKEAERLAKIVRRTNNAVIITDVEGRIEWVNDGFTRLSGYCLEDAAGKRLNELMYGPDSHPESVERLADAIRLRASTNAEVVNYGKDGREYVVATEIAPLFDAGGTLTGFMVLESDITEKCAAEARLKALNSELTLAHQEAERASKVKSEFLANMSHEIRTPMTAIIGFSDMLLEEGISEAEKRKAVGTIQRNGSHLLELINDILDLSKVEAGKFDIELRNMDPAQVMKEVEDLLAERAGAQGNRLIFESNGPLPKVIRCDSTRLKQALVNLVGNAIKFTRQGVVKVTARCDREREQLFFQVTDTGIGMNAQQLQQIFQPFRQADASMTRKFGGTGLGLTITKQIAEMLGGDVTVESQLGSGSTFTLRVATGDLTDAALQAGAKDEPAEKKPAPGDAAARLNGRVLLVEDGPDNRRLISFILTKAGAEVTMAENGQLGLDETLRAWKAGSPYDVVLMDMQMPVMDGYAAAAQLRHAGYTGQVLALTAHAMRGDINKCLEAGCDGYLTKPIDRKAFLSEVGARMQMSLLHKGAAVT